MVFQILKLEKVNKDFSYKGRWVKMRTLVNLGHVGVIYFKQLVQNHTNNISQESQLAQLSQPHLILILYSIILSQNFKY